MANPHGIDSVAVGVYGSRRARPVHQGDGSLAADCFSVFQAFSVGMGYSSPDFRSGLWGMNDAVGPLETSSSGPGLCGWFQVTPSGAVGAPALLQPLAGAAVATLERFGELDLSAIEFFVPLDAPIERERQLMLDAQPWFATATSSARARVRISVELSTGGPSLSGLGDAVDALGARSDGFVFSTVEDETPVDFADPVPWRWWLGEAGTTRTVEVTASIPGWEPLALGRAAYYVSVGCRVRGASAAGIRVARS